MALIPHARRRPWSSRSEFATLAMRFGGGVVHGGAHRLVEMVAVQLEVQHCVNVAAGIRDGTRAVRASRNRTSGTAAMLAVKGGTRR
jgi:hypothetical protein